MSGMTTWKWLRSTPGLLAGGRWDRDVVGDVSSAYAESRQLRAIVEAVPVSSAIGRRIALLGHGTIHASNISFLEERTSIDWQNPIPGKHSVSSCTAAADQ